MAAAIMLKNQKKVSCLTNRWTDFDEIWHSQVSRFSGLLNIIMTVFWKKLVSVTSSPYCVL